ATPNRALGAREPRDQARPIALPGRRDPRRGREPDRPQITKDPRRFRVPPRAFAFEPDAGRVRDRLEQDARAGPARRSRHRAGARQPKLTSRFSYSRSPPGFFIFTSPPASLPRSERASGLVMLMLPWLMSDSSAPTMR